MTSAYQRLVEALGELDLNFAAAVDGAARGRSTTGESCAGESCAGAPGAGAPGAGPDCRRCPVRQLVALVRQTRPEVLDHLVCAAGELVTAVRLVVRQPETAPPERRSGASVERIDVTD